MPIFISLIFLIGSVNLFNTSANLVDCVDNCYENSDYKKFKAEVSNGSDTAQYSMNAALYNCGMTACPEKNLNTKPYVIKN